MTDEKQTENLDQWKITMRAEIYFVCQLKYSNKLNKLNMDNFLIENLWVELRTT